MQTAAPTIKQIFQKAEALRENGDYSAAEQIYRNLIQQCPGFHQAYHGLSLLANQVGKVELAQELLEQAISLNKSVALYHGNLCEMYRRSGKLEQAISAGTRASALQPDNINFMYNLALANADNGDLHPAIELYRQLLSINPGHGFACNNLGAALEKTGKIDEALEYYRRAIEINPGHSEAQNNLGAIYSERGQLEDARKCFSEAINANSGFVESHYNLSSLKTYTLNDPDLTRLKRLLKDVDTFSTDAKIRYYFALGKAFEDVAEYKDSFNAYERANRLKFSTIRYNEKHAKQYVNRIKNELSDTVIKKYRDSGLEDTTPVFIVGMPRSGTSLIEQILASHAEVHGAGELKYFNEIVQTNRKKLVPPGIPSRDMPEYDFGSMANDYLERLRKIDSGSRYITDKMPANFFYIGIIHLMFPNAKIIHSMRDPMDSCFSCYAKLFNETMDFAYDLRTLGNYYVNYIELMNHWKKVLPDDVILDVEYENVVMDMEGQTRRMLEHLGLSWDDNCRDFYLNKRHVKTASVAQVRKPIYSTSVSRWKHFEDFLTPLQDIVQPHRSTDLIKTKNG